MASIIDRFLMIPRELPSYLKVAYRVRYANEPNSGNCIARICHAVQRTFALIKELVTTPIARKVDANRVKLQQEFAAMRGNVAESAKPLCVYLVSSSDCNGAILGDQVYYYHHYKIHNLQRHFTVVPHVVASQADIQAALRGARQQCSNKEIRFVDLVCHGDGNVLILGDVREPIGLNLYVDAISRENMDPTLFAECAPDASILLDACLAGQKFFSIASHIAQKTPGRTVIGPARLLCFSKPIIHIKDKVPRVVAAVHGFAIFKAFQCSAFCASSNTA